ncbi:hypothetical protein [Streptomyces sp. NRRL S-87]|uniref:hypothetical protein n=1 Tax=Streptomyces sp. NRRL S-87 TaxID=1463920 RepID=UPI0004C1A58B|nr:hypothetical protein [Streptomyces sp. NRRL S-87]
MTIDGFEEARPARLVPADAGWRGCADDVTVEDIEDLVAELQLARAGVAGADAGRAALRAERFADEIAFLGLGRLVARLVRTPPGGPQDALDRLAARSGGPGSGAGFPAPPEVALPRLGDLLTGLVGQARGYGLLPPAHKVKLLRRPGLDPAVTPVRLPGFSVLSLPTEVGPESVRYVQHAVARLAEHALRPAGEPLAARWEFDPVRARGWELLLGLLVQEPELLGRLGPVRDDAEAVAGWLRACEREAERQARADQEAGSADGALRAAAYEWRDAVRAVLAGGFGAHWWRHAQAWALLRRAMAREPRADDCHRALALDVAAVAGPPARADLVPAARRAGAPAPAGAVGAGEGRPVPPTGTGEAGWAAGAAGTAGDRDRLRDGVGGARQGDAA